MEENSEKIWEGFYNKYSRPFWFYINKMCGDQNMADDVFQESFYRFLRAKPVIMNENHMKSYLYKIAFGLIIDKKRRIKVEKRAFEEEKETYKRRKDKESQESAVISSLVMEKIFKLIKPRERTLLWLAYVEGYSHREIAEITETKEKSVKTQLFRARKELAGFLKKKEYKGGMEP